ncbi:MAG: amylo-alpha-1,6-glucosidase [bacterium]
MSMDRDTLLEELAIAVPRGRVAQYFYGDNLDGYFEGHTFRYAKGAGYLVHGRAVYRDFLSWCGDHPNKRERAEGAVIYPHAVRHLHGPTWWDEFMVLRKRRAIALRVFSRRPQSLAVAPILSMRKDQAAVYPAANGFLVSDTKHDVHIAVSSSQPFRHDGTASHEGCFAPVFRTSQQESDFTVYLAFSRDPDAAVAQAQRLREDDGARQHKQGIYELLTRSNLWTSDADYNRALMWAKLSNLFMVTSASAGLRRDREEYGKGIWAGLPCFRDNWGRDTFIALPGTLLAAGLFDDAREVIRTFLRYQNTDRKSRDYGRIPNHVTSPRDIIYNTTDGTLWLIREILEYLFYTGDEQFAQEMYPAVKLALDGTAKNYADAKGFLTHDDADTWMDARIEGRTPWSPRGNRANDIQVLFFSALLAGARLAAINKDRSAEKKYRAMAARVKKAFPKAFWDSRKKQMADRVDAKGKPDFKVRPNQLMLISVPLEERFIDEKLEEAVVRNATEELLYPHGIASLSQRDPWFHPCHDGAERYHKDAAYHNGTVWGWNAGFATTALCRQGHVELAWRLAKNLSDQILNMGCRGAMSELVDALPDTKGKITLSGTWAQAWSTAEFARNGYQDFGGFRPRLLDDVIELAPRVPEDWTNFSATYPFGRGAALQVAFTRQHGKDVYVIHMDGHTAPVELKLHVHAFGLRYEIDQDLLAADTLTVVIDAKSAVTGLNGKWRTKPVRGGRVPASKPLSFVKPSLAAKPRSIREKDFLRKLLEPASPPARKRKPVGSW